MKEHQYSSKNAETLRALIARLHKTGIFPFGFTTKFAEEHKLKLNSVREGLKGRPVAIETQEAIVSHAETLVGIKPTKPKRLDFSRLTPAELIEQRLLPTGYLEQAAELAETTVMAVGHFARNQREGAKRYVTTEPIEKAFQQLVGYNKELELIHRLERLLEKLESQ